MSAVAGAAACLLASFLSSLLGDFQDKKFYPLFRLKNKDGALALDLSQPDKIIGALAGCTAASRIFIAYAQADKNTTCEVSNQIKKQVMRVWLDDDEIAFGDSISAKVEEGINTSGYLLAISPRSYLSCPWAKKESSWALHETGGDVGHA